MTCGHSLLDLLGVVSQGLLRLPWNLLAFLVSSIFLMGHTHRFQMSRVQPFLVISGSLIATGKCQLMHCNHHPVKLQNYVLHCKIEWISFLLTTKTFFVNILMCKDSFLML
jgi:hypothetical protein